MSLNRYGKENWDKSFEAFKKPVVVEISKPFEEETVIETLEGEVVAGVGFRLVKGSQGEPYPIPPDTFEKYEEVEGGYAKRKSVVNVLQLVEAGEVSVPWGAVLSGESGDYLVMENEDNMWVVEQNIFEDTYEKV